MPRKVKWLWEELMFRYRSFYCPKTKFIFEGHDWVPYYTYYGVNLPFRWKAVGSVCKRCNTRKTIDIYKVPLCI